MCFPQTGYMAPDATALYSEQISSEQPAVIRAALLSLAVCRK